MLFGLLLSAQNSFAQNSPLSIWGGGLDGSTYQQTVIYSEFPYGLMIEAPLDPNGNRLPIEFNWRGGGNTALRIMPNKYIGIGTANPTQKLTVNGSINLENPTGGNYLGFGAAGLSEYNTLGSMYSSAGLVLAHGLKPNSTMAGLVYSYPNMSRNAIVLGDNFSFGGIKFFIKSASQETVDAPFVADPAMQLTDGGNLLIGKTSQSNNAYKVDVGGKIRANEIVVNTTGADFVFENGYRLRPIAELEKFVKQNKHLPEIPMAKTMQQEGVGVSELQTKLLQKVEELTLYIIQQQKEIDKLKKKLDQ